jgi:hypothetical protein
MWWPFYIFAGYLTTQSHLLELCNVELRMLVFFQKMCPKSAISVHKTNLTLIVRSKEGHDA